MRRSAFVALALLAVSLIGSVSATEHVETVVTFDPSAGEYPEGIAADRQGDLYVSLAPLGQIWKITPDGERSLFAALVDPASLPLPLGALGLAVDPRGNVYAALASFDPATHGVWRISPDGAEIARLPGSEAIQLPNGLAFDQHQHLYVTDSLLGAIWRIAPGNAAQLWLQHELLLGTSVPELPLPIGANGVAFLAGDHRAESWHGNRSWAHRSGALYVANTTGKHVVRIPVGQDGSPGMPEVTVAFDGPADFLDGIAVDARGNLYPLVTGRSTLVRVSPAGDIATLAMAADGLDFPASLTFGKDDGRALYVTNFAVFPSPDPQRPGPGVVRLDMGAGVRDAGH